jgi:Holliday junction resolvase RusA-like endonuclease
MEDKELKEESIIIQKELTFTAIDKYNQIELEVYDDDSGRHLFFYLTKEDMDNLVKFLHNRLKTNG